MRKEKSYCLNIFIKMDKSTANKLIIDTFSHPFDETKFLNFSKNLFVDLEIDITEWNASIQSSLDVKNNIEKFHKTFSWRITIPFRFLKKFFTKMIQEIHNGIF